MVDYSALGIKAALSQVPKVDISHVRGNVDDHTKQLASKVFSYFVSTREKSYGAEIGQRLQLVEVNVHECIGLATYGETVFEIKVEKDMCNVFGTLHGACAAYIVDPCSVSSLVVLGIATGADGTGVSQSMNLIWHQPAHIGAKLRIRSTSLFIHGRVRSARCEIWNRDQLCVSAVHSTIHPWQNTVEMKNKL